MNEIDFINAVVEIMKRSIDNNPNYNEWEKAFRKACEDEVKELAKQYYNARQQSNMGV